MLKSSQLIFKLYISYTTHSDLCLTCHEYKCKGTVCSIMKTIHLKSLNQWQLKIPGLNVKSLWCKANLLMQPKTINHKRLAWIETIALVLTIGAIYPISDKVFMSMWVAWNIMNLLESTVNFVPLPKTSFPAPPVFTQCHTTHQNPLSHATQIYIYI